MDSKSGCNVKSLWAVFLLSSTMLFYNACDEDIFGDCAALLEFVLDNKVENLKPVYSLGDTITIKGSFSDTLVDRLTENKYNINRPNYYYSVGMIRLDTFGGFSAYKDFDVLSVIGKIYSIDLSEPDGSSIYGDNGLYKVVTEKIGQFHQFEYKIVPRIKGVFWVAFISSLYFRNIKYNYVPNCQEKATMFTNTNNQLDNGWETFESFLPLNEATGNPSKQEFDDLGSIVFEVK